MTIIIFNGYISLCYHIYSIYIKKKEAAVVLQGLTTNFRHKYVAKL